MRNIKLFIEYDGTIYSGWQVQNRKQKTENRKQKSTVQATLERTLAQILQEKVKVIGSGRTDSGVHARAQVANFKTRTNLDCKNIQRALNSILPADIRITQARGAGPDFHARFNVQSKLYRYTIVNNSSASPFLHRYCYLIKYPLDIKKMQRATQYLKGKHNFRSFQAVNKKETEPVRTIKRLNIRNSKNTIELDIEADGFLFHMVRNIVGTLIEVGRGKLKPEDIKLILKAKNRTYAGPCVPAKGLCLMRVKYAN